MGRNAQFGQRHSVCGVGRHLVHSLEEGARTGIRCEPVPGAVGRCRQLDGGAAREESVQFRDNLQLAVVLGGDDASIGVERGNDTLEQDLDHRRPRDIALGQARKPHERLELRREQALLFEPFRQALHQPGVFQSGRDLGRHLHDDFVARPHPGGAPGSQPQEPGGFVTNA